MYIRYLIPFVFLLAIISLFYYNKLIKLRNKVENAWSGIDIQLQRRRDLMSTLIQLLNQSNSSKGLLEQIKTQQEAISSASSRSNRINAEDQLSQTVQTMHKIELKDNDLFKNTAFNDLQGQLADAENQVQLARRYYNGSVQEFNDVIDTFPGNFLGGLFGMQGYDYFEAEL